MQKPHAPKHSPAFLPALRKMNAMHSLLFPRRKRCVFIFILVMLVTSSTASPVVVELRKVAVHNRKGTISITHVQLTAPSGRFFKKSAGQSRGARELYVAAREKWAGLSERAQKLWRVGHEKWAGRSGRVYGEDAAGDTADIDVLTVEDGAGGAVPTAEDTTAARCGHTNISDVSIILCPSSMVLIEDKVIGEKRGKIWVASPYT